MAVKTGLARLVGAGRESAGGSRLLKVALLQLSQAGRRHNCLLTTCSSQLGWRSLARGQVGDDAGHAGHALVAHQHQHVPAEGCPSGDGLAGT